jgi:hypothetical protein
LKVSYSWVRLRPFICRKPLIQHALCAPGFGGIPLFPSCFIPGGKARWVKGGTTGKKVRKEEERREEGRNVRHTHGQ